MHDSVQAYFRNKPTYNQEVMCIQFSEEVCFPSSFRFSMSMFAVKYSTFRLFLHTLSPRAPDPSVSAMQGHMEKPQSDSSYPCPWKILSKVRLSGQLELEYLSYETYSLCCSCYDCGVFSKIVLYDSIILSSLKTI